MPSILSRQDHTGSATFQADIACRDHGIGSPATPRPARTGVGRRAQLEFHEILPSPPMAPSPSDAVSRHRESRRAAGLKLKQVWVPDTRSAEFAAELQRQCRAVGDEGHGFGTSAANATEGWH